MAKQRNGNPDDPPESEQIQQEVVHSLDELGRAFAQALGKTTDDEPDEDSVDDESADVPSAGVDALTKEEIDDAPVRISPDSILEALLFVGSPTNEKMTARKLASIMRDVAPREIKEITARLNAAYEEQQAPYRIVSENGGYRMVLEGSYEPVRARIYGNVREATLSQASIDVLAVVAYNQPIARPAIEKMLAKPVQGILLQLVRRELLRVIPDEENKRTRLYETTDRFLEVFGLEDYEDLPRSPDFDGQTYVE